MVGLNQSWRMAGAVQVPHDYAAARSLVGRLRDLGVFWAEEPLPCAKRQGLRRLRAERGVRIAGGEMISSVSQVID